MEENSQISPCSQHDAPDAPVFQPQDSRWVLATDAQALKQ